LPLLHHYIFISPKWKLIDVSDYFVGDNEICK